MKKNHLRKYGKLVLIALLVITLMLSFAACGGGEEEQTGPTTSVSLYDSGKGWPEVADPLSWEDINAFPIKSSDMSIEDARKLCVDFFRYTKTAVWIPSENYDFYHDYGQNREDTLIGSNLYGGLPYISLGSGSIYRLLDYMDPETGVVDVKNAGLYPKLFGNQCSFGAYWGWGRVINSPKYNWTENMVTRNGFYRVGPYTYDDLSVGFGVGNTTTKVIEDNGLDVMYQSYAQLKAGDGIVYWTTAGHVVMIATDAHVEYDAEGKIDPEASFVTVIDQGQSWSTGTNEAGDKFTYQNRVDGKRTFNSLIDGSYIPFTYAEWMGTDPIEDTEVTFSHTGETISLSQLFKSGVTCNYGLSDIYAVVRDSKGNEVLKVAGRAIEGGLKEIKFYKAGDAVTIWGDMDSLDAGKEYTVEIIAQIATGERPTIWSGKLEQ